MVLTCMVIFVGLPVFKINELNVSFQKLEKEQQNNPKDSTRKKTRVRVDINEIENEDTMERTEIICSWIIKQKCIFLQTYHLLYGRE